jgi:hypothetical protein
MTASDSTAANAAVVNSVSSRRLAGVTYTVQAIFAASDAASASALLAKLQGSAPAAIFAALVNSGFFAFTCTAGPGCTVAPFSAVNWEVTNAKLSVVPYSADSGLSPGALAAAIVVPTVLILAFCVSAYLRKKSAAAAASAALFGKGDPGPGPKETVTSSPLELRNVAIYTTV